MLGTVAAGLALGSVCEVKADPMMVRSGNDKNSLTIRDTSARILIADDGDNTEVFYVDGTFPEPVDGHEQGQDFRGPVGQGRNRGRVQNEQ